LSDPAVQHWITPAANFSGDVIAVARAPEGERLYILLADATGHGLAAAISVLPVITVFYSHVELGYPLDYLVMELNRQLRATMPSGRFVAASLLCIDEEAGSAELWQGGMPDIFLLDATGKPKERFAARHLPLGIVDFDQEMAELTHIEFGKSEQFVLFSDGLIEAVDADGVQFGIERLLDVLGKSPAENRLAAVRGSLYGHTGIGQPQDDISLLLVGGR
jgi:serine phosphatase RsbU (regulator of sigma subunit)